MLRFSILSCLLAATLLLPDTGRAGCDINLTVRNVSSDALEVFVHSRVKSKGGSWRALSRGGWKPEGDDVNWLRLDPGQSRTDVYRATFRCNAKRRYRFDVACDLQGYHSVDRRTIYHPAPVTWTRDQTPRADLTCEN